MAFSSYNYSKCLSLESDEEWYHGELSRVEAEQVLTVSGCDCFLVRVSEGALILSLIHHGQLHHINIKYGPSWYELDISSAHYTFTDLEELVCHYRRNEIGELQTRLGEVCNKIGTSDMNEEDDTLYERISEMCCHDSTFQKRHHDYATIYDKAKPGHIIGYNWYHGNITQQQAESAFSLEGDNGFLVRTTTDNLILTRQVLGWVTHDIIYRNPSGYRLNGKEDIFESVFEMITHYRCHPIDGSQVLGSPITSVPSGHELRTSVNSDSIFRKAEDQLRLRWKRYPNLPVAISAPHVVKIGNSVYVGGGMRRNNYKGVYKFDRSSNTWTPLPPCPTLQYGLTSLNNELVAIGGQIFSKKTTNAVYTFKGNEWIQSLPPMPTSRCLLSAASYENRIIIAAGGITLITATGKTDSTGAVEIYWDETRTWYRTNPLPFPSCAFKMCIVDHTCYVVGGTANEGECCIVLRATLSSLFKSATSKTSCLNMVWKQLVDEHPLNLPSPVELDGRLVTLGGSSEIVRRHGTRHISLYGFGSSTWVECKGAQLPVPLYRAGVVKLDNDQVMIVGGQPRMQQFSSAVFIGKSYKARKNSGASL